MTKIIGYWEGYAEQDARGKEHKPYPLTQIPEFYTHVPIAFCAPALAKPEDVLATTWEVDKSFVYSKRQILEWVQEIKARPGNNQKFLLSFQDTPTVHWFPNVDIEEFAKNVAEDVYSNNLDGINIDAESGMAADIRASKASAQSAGGSWSKSAWSAFGYKPHVQTTPRPVNKTSDPYAPTFIKLINALRNELDLLHEKYSETNPMLEPKLISYTCYTQSQYDKEILAGCRENIDYLTTMAYWDDFTQSLDLFRHYASQIGSPSKVGIGVKCPPGPSQTPLSEVKRLATWLKQNDFDTMMLWSATRDVSVVTGLQDHRYGEAIAQILERPAPELKSLPAVSIDERLTTSPLSVISIGSGPSPLLSAILLSPTGLNPTCSAQTTSDAQSCTLDSTSSLAANDSFSKSNVTPPVVIPEPLASNSGLASSKRDIPDIPAMPVIPPIRGLSTLPNTNDPLSVGSSISSSVFAGYSSPLVQRPSPKHNHGHKHGITRLFSQVKQEIKQGVNQLGRDISFACKKTKPALSTAKRSTVRALKTAGSAMCCGSCIDVTESSDSNNGYNSQRYTAMYDSLDGLDRPLTQGKSIHDSFQEDGMVETLKIHREDSLRRR